VRSLPKYALTADSLVVCRTEIRDLSRMCIVLKGQDAVIEQARRQLEDLVSTLRLRVRQPAPCSRPASRSPSGPCLTTQRHPVSSESSC
jgi:hypothetical protein